MKLIVAAFLFVTVYAAAALPAVLFDEEAAEINNVGLDWPLEEHYRAKRATCDVLSFETQWVTVNHAACALHCITKGYKGGKCKDTICHCRR